MHHIYACVRRVSHLKKIQTHQLLDVSFETTTTPKYQYLSLPFSFRPSSHKEYLLEESERNKQKSVPKNTKMISQKLFLHPMIRSFTNQGRCRWLGSNSAVVDKAERVGRVLAAKEEAGMTFDDLAKKLGVTNTYAAQLVLGEAKLTPGTAPKMREALPILSDADIQDMIESFPMRGYDDEILKEPHVYRTFEAITHYGVAIKSIINEQCGDGIMSAIDFYCDVGTTTGKHGEKRVVITFNGKFLPFIEQKVEDNSAPSPRD